MTGIPISRFSRTKGMTARARRLRQDLSDAEQKLWRVLRRDQIEGLHFRRQHPVGPYTLDFFYPALSLAIEVDGEQHNEADAKRRDERRTRWLASRGISVIRFWNNDALSNLEGVLQEIIRVAEPLAQKPIPSRRAARVDLPFSRGGGASVNAAPHSAAVKDARPQGLANTARPLAPLPLKGGGLGRGSSIFRREKDKQDTGSAP